MFARELVVRNYDRHALRLIKPDLAHAESSLEWLLLEDVAGMMGADFSGVSHDTERQRIKDILAGADNYNWMIECDRKVIGAVELNHIEQSVGASGVKTGNFSILIGDKSYWGRHIAPHVLATVMDWAFTEGGFGRLTARALTENSRSYRALEHLGFSFRSVKHESDDGRRLEWRNYVMGKADWTHRHHQV